MNTYAMFVESLVAVAPKMTSRWQVLKTEGALDTPPPCSVGARVTALQPLLG